MPANVKVELSHILEIERMIRGQLLRKGHIPLNIDSDTNMNMKMEISLLKHEEVTYKMLELRAMI